MRLVGCLERYMVASFFEADSNHLGNHWGRRGPKVGENETRTLDSLTTILVFETSAFNHSATSPEFAQKLWKRHAKSNVGEPQEGAGDSVCNIGNETVYWGDICCHSPTVVQKRDTVV